ncbi:MAG: fibronectin type III domain-containing protein [Candidatus Aminicenantaceae bacterium]
MRRSFLTGFVVLLALFWSCGKKGPIMPPLQKIPKAVEGVSLAQIGLEFRLRWRIPTNYVDGSPMESLSALEIWIFEEDKPGDTGEKEGEESVKEEIKKEDVKEEINKAGAPPAAPFVPAGPERMSSEARLLEEILPDHFPEYQKDPEGSPLEFFYVFRFDKAQIGTKHFGFSFKVRDARGRFSDFSSWVKAEPRNVSVPPRGLKAELSRNKVTLTWRVPAKHLDDSEPAVVGGYNVYRTVGEAEPGKLNMIRVTEPKYEDRTVQYGGTYRYLVRAVTGEAAPFAESGDSKPIEVAVKDTFAPSAPKGLIAIAGEDFISLSWDRSRERDLSSYRVWRRPAESDEYTLLTPEGILDSNFTDTSARKKVRYEYAVTALDQEGNESTRSMSVTAAITGDSHADLPL